MNLSDLTLTDFTTALDSSIRGLSPKLLDFLFNTAPSDPSIPTTGVNGELYVKLKNVWISNVLYECLNILHIDLDSIPLAQWLPMDHKIISFPMCVASSARHQARLVQSMEHYVRARLAERWKEIPPNPAKFKEVI